MRLIDADALRDKLQAEIDKAKPPFDDVIGSIRCGVRLARNIVEDEPTVDAEPHWIPCSERLPEAPFGCLVTVEDEEPMTGALFPNLLPYFVGWDGEQWNDGDGFQCPFEVIAWMPLPKPYEVKE